MILDLAQLALSIAAFIIACLAFTETRIVRDTVLDTRGDNSNWRALPPRRRGQLARMLDAAAGEHLRGVQRIAWYDGELGVDGIVRDPVARLDPARPGELLRWHRTLRVSRWQKPWWWRP